MSDVPGDALHRLSAEPGAVPATSEKPAVMLAEPSECCAGEPSATEVPVQVPAQWGFHPAKRCSIAVRFVLQRRRQTAAAVVLLCMTGIWFDRNSWPDPATANAEDPGLPDVAAMLNEFDAVSAQPLREPAEPIETSGYGSVPLTIPHDGIEPSGSEAVFSPYAASSVANAVYPEDAAVKSSTVGSEPALTTPGKVRFTGNIQPLK